MATTTVAAKAAVATSLAGTPLFGVATTVGLRKNRDADGQDVSFLSS